MLAKNQEIEIDIGALGSEGEGIGHFEDGITVFVSDALPGDRVLAHIVKVKKTYAYAFAARILTPSSFRVEARCPVAKKCGGCTLLHLDYGKQLEYKQTKVRDCITRIGGIENPPMNPIVGADEPFYYRNKAQFPVGTDKDGNPVIGFYRKHSHDVVANTSCVIQAWINEKLMKCTEDFLRTRKISVYNEETGRGLVRHIFTRVGFSTKEVMVCLVLNGEKLPYSDELTDGLKEVCEASSMKLSSVSINVNTERTNVILGKKCICLYGNLYIEDYIDDVKFRISPLSFYQVNPMQTVKLYTLARDYAGLTGDETVWDLYCGIGTISLFMARKAGKVYGVEIVPEAIEDAKINAAINNIDNAEFFVGASEDVADTLPTPDVIVVDPPRKGCDEKLLETIVRVSPKRLVYVSCDPATLARDLKYLVARGFSLEAVTPVDQFCHTMHDETCCLLVREQVKDDDLISIKVDLEGISLEQGKYVPEEKPTYGNVKKWIKEKYGFNVTNLYIGQVKSKLGLEKRLNYNIGSGEGRVPNCPQEKEEAIIEAFKYFGLI